MSSRNDIPAVPESVDPALRRTLQRMREEMRSLLGFVGDDPAIRSSTSGNLGGGGGGITIIGGGGGDDGGGGEVDLTPPPTPSDFAAQPGITTVFLSWSGIGYPQGHGHKRALIYGVQKSVTDPTVPVFADAEVVAEAFNALTIYALTSEPNIRWHLWLTFESVDGVESTTPAGGVNGVVVTTGMDVRGMIDILTRAAEDPGFPYSRLTLRGGLINVADDDGNYSPVFNIVTTAFTQNGVLVPPGVYISDGYIANGTITNAMIGNAVIDDAKIATLSAVKFTGGEMRVGSFLQSTNYTSGPSGVGFRINADGSAELQATYIRGQLVATQINSNGLSIRDGLGNVILNAGGTPSIAPSVVISDGSGITLADLVAGTEPAAVVDISGPQVFKTPANSTTPDPVSVTLTATATGLDSPTYVWKVDGTVQSGATTSTFTLPSFAHTVGSKLVRVDVTGSGGKTAYDTITVYSLKDGDNGYSAGLTNENQSIVCSYLGVPNAGQFPITSQFIVAQGADFLTSGVTYSVVSSTGFVGAAIDTDGNITVSGITADNATAKFKAEVDDGPTFERVLKAHKVKEGVPGADGNTGPAGQRGSIVGYSNSVTPPIYSTAPWNGTSDDTNATNLIWQMLGNTGSAPNTTHLRIGDAVTLKTATNTAAATRFWSGTAWLDPGVVISGNLLVGGTISGATNINISGFGQIEGGRSYSIVAPADGGIISRTAAFISNTTMGQDFGVVGYTSQSSVGAGVYGLNQSLTVGVGVWGRGPTGVRANSTTATGDALYSVAQPSGYALNTIGRVNISASSGAAFTASTTSGNAGIMTTTGTSANDDGLRVTAPGNSGNCQIRLRTTTGETGRSIMMRWDQSEFNIMQTASGSAGGGWTADRPFTITAGAAPFVTISRARFRDMSIATTGAAVAGFSGTKPGTAQTNHWMLTNINGADYYIPAWPA